MCDGIGLNNEFQLIWFISWPIHQRMMSLESLFKLSLSIDPLLSIFIFSRNTRRRPQIYVSNNGVAVSLQMNQVPVASNSMLWQKPPIDEVACLS